MTIRPTNNWGLGDLPAPYAIGDVLRLHNPQPGALPGYYVVVAADSVDEGDAWRFYLSAADPESGKPSRMASRFKVYECYADRSDWHEAHDLASFDLIETADPEGLDKRNAMLDDGWTFEPTRPCPTCGRPLPKGDS